MLEFTSILLSNETRKKSNQEQKESSLVTPRRKRREGKKKSRLIEGVSLLSQEMSLEEWLQVSIKVTEKEQAVEAEVTMNGVDTEY